jgi:hypothetical protein
MSISAFEGFVEEVMAEALHAQGASFSRIAKLVGNWTNPDIRRWREELDRTFGVDMASGFSVKTTRGTAAGNWSMKTVNCAEAGKLGSAWMNVRHALTHGEAAGLGAERWPTAIRPQTDPVSGSCEVGRWFGVPL